MRNKTLIVIILMLVMSVLNTGSLFGQLDILRFTLGPPADLITGELPTTVTWQATIENISDYWANNLVIDVASANPDPIQGTLTFAAGLPIAIGPHGTWGKADFASFLFNSGLPIGTVQTIQFSVAGTTDQKGAFETKYQTGTVTIVPEPSSLLLLGTGLLGLVGIGVIRQRKK